MTRDYDTPNHRPYGGSGQPIGREVPPLHPGAAATHAPVLSSDPPPDPPSRRPRRLKSQAVRVLKSWQFWGVASVVAFSGLGLLSAAVLLKLPALPNCPAVFWPVASASLRLYCAQLAAEKRTVEDLLEAIALVNALPADHPLRPEVDHNIEQWSQEILDLADDQFQAGQLQKAIDAAQKIPSNTTAAQRVDNQIEQWKTVWSKAEGIYQNAEAALGKQDLRQAFLIATRLLSSGNRYWETTKYKELTELITVTREDINKLGKAKNLLASSGLSNLVEALRLAEEVKSESRVYGEAKQLIADIGQGMLDLAKAALDRQSYDEALNIVRQIPELAGLKEEVKDFNTLADAQSQAWGGTVEALQEAIRQAQQMPRDRPLYNRAQELVARWTLEIEDVKHLDRANQLAQGGTVGDLTAAIAEARLIPASNPRGDEAQAKIDAWTTTVQTIVDRPVLARAEQLASGGDVPSLQSAINEASRIQAGRALYNQASTRIEDWTDRMQRMQDQPLLDRARQLANDGDLAGAIATAKRIGDGRALSADVRADLARWTSQLQTTQDQPFFDRANQLAGQGNYSDAIQAAGQVGPGPLYNDAQSNIQTWRSQSNGQDLLAQASNMASLGTQPMLLSAIQIADQISGDNPSRAEADRLISQWSLELLQIAEARASTNLSAAINIAQSIPAGTDAYDAAQSRIQAWRQQLGGQ